MRYWKFPAAALLLFSLSTPARAELIGATLKVVNQVTAQFNRDTRTLIEGDGVSQDEVIAVASDALSELVFKDETKLALGPGSQMKLDKFVYDPEKTSGSIAVNLLKGTFRFMTGVADKPTYVIRTPAASITVRGTIFDVYVLADGTTWLLLHEGAVAVRNQRGKCSLLNSPGHLIRVTASGEVGIPVNWDDMPGSNGVPFDRAFPFVGSPPSMDPRPVFTRDAVLTMPAASSKGSQSCDETEEEPKKPTPQRAGDDDNGPKVRKPVRRAAEDDGKPVKKSVKRVTNEDDKPKYKPNKPTKIVVYDKPKKTKRPRDKKYDDEKVAKGAAALAIIGIAAGIALSKGKGGGGHKPGGYGGGGHKPGGYGGGGY